MLMQAAAGSDHLVAAESAALCFGFTLADLLNQCRSMQVSRGFACYYEISISDVRLGIIV